MSAADEVKALRNLLAERDEEIRQLRAAMTPNADIFAKELRLQRRQGAIVAALVKASPNAIPMERLYLQVYGPSSETAVDVLHSHISRIRPKLLFRHGVIIKSARHIGYWLEQTDATRLRALIEN